MTPHQEVTTRRGLRDAGYRPRSIRDEVRTNLIASLRSGERLFAGIHGYEGTVIPQLENAILAGHDIILLGERGQAKTRLARSLVQLLDPWMPIIAGSETNDDPFQPVSAFGRRMIAEFGDEVAIEWVPRDRRFAEKLATPDATIADLIGEIDPIKLAEGRYLSNEEVISYGLIPRANRGIFNLNELPDLAERIQVGLLNILEEEDVQIRGFQVRMPLDMIVVATANPDDYTNRGRIITPLKDRFGSQIRTHYPLTVADELSIVRQEWSGSDVNGITVRVPDFMSDLVADISRVARKSPEISQRSGVSVRMTISNYEALVANSQRRALLLGETMAVPRISDLHAIYPSSLGKLEFETFGSLEDREVIDRIIGESVRHIYTQRVRDDTVEPLIQAMANGLVIEASDMRPAVEYPSAIAGIDGLQAMLRQLGGSDEPAVMASSLEFVLEGLYRNRRIGKIEAAAGQRYGVA